MPQPPAAYYYLYAIPMPQGVPGYGNGAGNGMPPAPNMMPPAQGQRAPEMQQYMPQGGYPMPMERGHGVAQMPVPPQQPPAQ
ncbi:MAG: hypothetical protein QJT81_19475 [Candidatus Thiothrix putei]|uniref:Uncharacterized protein n=1 Tax=Candidatus Thiothrix putei TaxID=3080811 RepID=A0AA95HCY8_9GAMM|nr:MAG: hypothetical protein QJT81_19475 [Candidatus Thiothrix putei]